jgi:hypothetical protein
MTTSDVSRARWTGGSVLEGFVLVLGAWYILAYVVLALVRARYPFELEWMEGAVLEQVSRVAAGHHLYVAPSMHFIPFQYPPFFFYVGAFVSRVAGGGFLPLRLLSFIASLGCFATLFQMARREAGSAKAGFFAVALFAACFRADGAWYDLARIDSLCLLLVLLGAYLIRFGRSPGHSIAAGVLLALAFLTKQSALLIALPLLAYLMAVSWRRGLLAFLVFTSITGGAILVLNRIHHGWYVYYVFKMPARMQRIDPVSVNFWREDILGPLAIAAAMGLGYMWTAFKRADARPSLFYPSMALGMIGSAWLSMLHAGAYYNNLIPAYAVISLLFGLAVEKADLFPFTPALCLVQLLLLFYDPRQEWPSSRSRDAGCQLVSLIAATPGDALLPQHGYLGAMAGKRTFAHSMAVYDVMRAGDPADAARLVGQFQHALANRQFGLVIVDRVDSWIRDDLDRGYRMAGPATADPEALWPLTGLHTRPESVYVPK